MFVITLAAVLTLWAACEVRRLAARRGRRAYPVTQEVPLAEAITSEPASAARGPLTPPRHAAIVGADPTVVLPIAGRTWVWTPAGAHR